MFLDNSYTRESVDLLWNDIRYNLTNNKVLWFILFDELLNYHISLFKVTSENPFSNLFKQYETKFYSYLWKYGELFVTFFNNKVQFWNVNQKFGEENDIEKVRCQLIVEYQKEYYSPLKIVEFKNLVNGVYVKWNETIIPALVKYKYYVDTLVDFIEMYKKTSIMDMKKLFYVVNNSSENTIKREIDSILKSTDPFIYNINPWSENSPDVMNQFIEFKGNVATSGLMYQNITNWRNLFKDIFGMAIPNDNKKERKNLSETLTENYTSENIETLILKNLTVFGQQVALITGQELEFEETNKIIQDQTEFIKGDE